MCVEVGREMVRQMKHEVKKYIEKIYNDMMH